MIELGLGRIGRLMKHIPQPWKAIHVAGTNGKGTICASLSAMLHGSGVRCGRFTSPHLIDRWDCITINDQTVRESLFRDAEDAVRCWDKTEGVGASEFELLTATAFEIFNREKVEIGVIEAGLGGSLDATNILENKAVTVISKIGLDHQSFLGNTIEAIARHKAGIMRSGVPCVLDRSNLPSVRKVIEDYAKEIGTDVVPSSTESVLNNFPDEDFQVHQWQNLACAYTAFHYAYLKSNSAPPNLLPTIQNLQWPGRLQMINITSITGRRENVLLDGAHNVQSAGVLGAYVDQKLRSMSSRVTWVFAVSGGKEPKDLLEPLLRPGDCISSVEFGPVDGMPWVKAMDPEIIFSAAVTLGLDQSLQYNANNDLLAALRWATETASGGPLVIAGSLYLVSDVLRLLRKTEQQNRLVSGS